MSYLIETYWVWSLVAVGCGGGVGYLWLQHFYRRSELAWAVVVLAIGLVVVLLQLLPQRAGLYLEILLLLASAYLVGLLLGGWLRRSTLIPEAGAVGASAVMAAEARPAAEAREQAAAMAAETARLAAEAKAAKAAREAASAEAAENARLAAEAKAAEAAREAAAAREVEDERLAAEAKVAEEPREAALVKAAKDAMPATENKLVEVASAAIHPGVKPAGIAAPRDQKADDLKLVKGIGPKNERLCNSLGVYHLDQIADWTPEEAAWVGQYIAFPGRIEREHWIDQARLLASGGDSEHSAAVKAGTIVVDATADKPLDDAEVAAVGASLPAQVTAVEGESEHQGRRPYGLLAPRQGGADDLQRIRGIGPQNEKRLHALGIWHFDQIAAWSAENVSWVGSYLAFPGRIDREKWIVQAKDLAAGRNDGLPPKGRRRNAGR